VQPSLFERAANGSHPAPAEDLVGRLSTLLGHPALFWTTMAAAASIVWIAPRPPMTDLPQHAAQIVHLKALLLGQSAWAETLQLNFATTYLTTYLLGLLLSFVMPATIALKLLLTGAFVAFVGSCRQLRAERGGDPRLDYLFIPGWFGFAFDFGMVSFLIAAPIAIQMIRIGWRHAEQPNSSVVLWLLGLGTLLLVSHGLMFLFGGLVCGVLLIVHARSGRAFAWACAPYAALLVICAGYTSLVVGGTPGAGWTPLEWWTSPLARLFVLFVFPLSGFDFTLLPLGAALVGAALLGGTFKGWRAAMPLLVLLSVMMLLPDSAMATDYINGRFAVFVLPFLAFALTLRSDNVVQHFAAIAIVGVCWGALVLKATRVAAFAQEARALDEVLAAAAPGKRLLTSRLIPDPASAAARHAGAYMYYPTWYEVERGGFVEFSFATFHPQIVRFRTIPPWRRGEGPASTPAFDWTQPWVPDWDYFVARRGDDGGWPKGFMEAPRCQLSLVREAGPWGLFQRGACRPLS
jgi:hypothetical protein